MEILEELLTSGMSVARFNFSHGSHEYHQETLDNLRQAMMNTGQMCAVMLDTKGPEIRTGFLKDATPVKLEAGKDVILTTNYEYKGDAKTIAISYKQLPRDVDLPTLTDKDVDDIIHWGIPNDIDFIAASFVRKPANIDNINKVVGGAEIQIISKIENQEGLINFDEILKKTDAVMVARGDLGMEIPTEKIFLAQKLMIQKCNNAGKPVVTATQMLESMVKNPRPTRAEATDVANAVLDGTDCVMLSGETAAGSFPVQAVQVMGRICREAEMSLDYYSLFKGIMKQAHMPMAPLESLASSAVRTAHKVDAQLIIVLTRGGSTARLVAKYRPSVPVLAVAVPVLTTDSLTWTCSSEKSARQTLLTRGLLPLLAEGSARTTDSDTTDEILTAAIHHAKGQGLCKKGGSIVALHRIGAASVIKIVNVP